MAAHEACVKVQRQAEEADSARREQEAIEAEKQRQLELEAELNRLKAEQEQIIAAARERRLVQAREDAEAKYTAIRRPALKDVFENLREQTLCTHQVVEGSWIRQRHRAIQHGMGRWVNFVRHAQEVCQHLL